MAAPLIAAVASFIARQGASKAIKKFGEKAVEQAQKSRVASVGKDALAKVGKRRRTTTKQERKEGKAGSALQPGKKGRKPSKKTQVARRAANKAADVVRGAKRVGGIGTGLAASTGVGKALSGGEEPPKPTVTGSATGATDRSGIGGGGVRQTTRVKTTPKPDTRARATATRSQAEEARRTMSGPDARPSTPETSPRPTRSRVGGTGSPSSPKGDRRTTTADIVGEGSTGVEKARRNPRTVAEGQKRAKKRGAKVGTFIGKDARKKAAVTKEELEASGLSLRDYLNRERGLTRREGMKTGGAVKKGGKVRGVRIAKKGFRPAKMR